MMFSGEAIKKGIEEGRIIITPYSEDQVNPNSYNLRLGRTLKIYKDVLPHGIRPWIPVRTDAKYSRFEWYDSKLDYLRDMFRPANYLPNPKYAIDPRKQRETIEIQIPDNGLIIRPNTLYLGHTEEYTANKDTVPMLDGRSSIGRLGLYIHVTAGFGDVGFGWDYEKNTGRHEGRGNQWTLENNAIHQMILYPGMPICQMRIEEITPDFVPYNGRYASQNAAQASNFHINAGEKLGRSK